MALRGADDPCKGRTADAIAEQRSEIEGITRRRRRPILLLDAVRENAAAIRTRIEANTARAESTGCLVWLSIRNDDQRGRMMLHINGRRVMTVVSRVVYTLEHDVEPGEQMVLHGQCDRPECCEISHLRLGNAADNVRDMMDRGRARIGFDHPFAKLRPIDLDFIKSRLSTHSDAEIAAALGHLVCRRTICGIRRGETWGHLTGIERQDRSALPRRCA